MKSLTEIYNNGSVFQPQHTKSRTQFISEIEKQFNQIFLDLKANFPALTTVIKNQSDLDTFKKQWLLSFAENGITTLRQIELGMKFARQQNKPYIISPGQFVEWCKEAMAQELGLPSVVQVMKEFRTYSAEIGFSCQTAEQFPWSHPVMYWIVTDLRKHMRQYNQSELEVEKRAEFLINKWANKLSNGETIPEIKVQIENKEKTAHSISFQCDHPIIKKYLERGLKQRKGARKMSKVDYKHSKSKTDSDIKDLWQTPIEVYEFLNARFSFVCDVAASDHNHLHLNYLTESYDSLINGWTHLKSGYAFCNPPYSRILPWIKKAREAADHGVGTVMLLPVDTSLEWFNQLRKLASEIYFIVNGRLSFVRSDNKQKINGNNRGSLFVVFNPRGLGDCRVSFVDRNEIFTTYEKIKDTLPDPQVATVWPKEVNSIFDSIEYAKNLSPELQIKVKQSINKMIIDRLPPDQINTATRFLVNRMEGKQCEN